MFAPGEKLLTAKEVADQVRVNVQTFRRWCRQGNGPKAYHLSEHTERYALSDVIDWLEKRRQQQIDADFATHMDVSSVARRCTG